MRRLSEMSFYITQHESAKRDGRPSLLLSLHSRALLLIRNVEFAGKLDSSLKEFKFFFFSFVPPLLFIVFARAREDSQFFKQIYEERENWAVSKKRQMPEIGQE